MPDPMNECRSVAIVTGAAQGIGWGIAQALASAGFQVALADIDGPGVFDRAAELQEAGHSAVAACLDVADANGWRELIQVVVSRWNGLDALINNAGISPRGTAESTDEALWERTLNTNLKGAWLGIRAALPHLKARRGRIVNIGSTHCTIPLRNLFAYSVSKAGLLGLTRQIALEYLHEGITCNLVAPGWVASPGEIMIQRRAGVPDFPEGILSMSSPEQVAQAVLFLISDAARNITGETIHLDGGLHAFGDVRWVHFADGPRAEG